MGPDRDRQMAGHIRLWHLLRALLYRPGRAVAVAPQRAAVSSNAAGWAFTILQLCRSVQRNAAATVFQAAYEPDRVAESAAALHAGLGLQYPEIVWQRPSSSDWICRHEGNEAAQIHRGKPRSLCAWIRSRHRTAEFNLGQC